MRILHLLPASGGGTERFVRSICAAGAGPAGHASTHLLLHLSDTQAALESPATAQFALLNLPEQSQAWPRFMQGLMASYGVDLVHVHMLSNAVIEMLQSVTDFVVSLHDVSFLSTAAFSGTKSIPAPDPQWIARCSALLQRARNISAPSDFLRTLFQQHYPGHAVQLIAPGIARASVDANRLAAEAANIARKPCIGIVGAIGPHKGSALLEQIWALPGASAFRWVLIGYTGERNYPQQDAQLDLTVHGPFAAEDTTELLQHYTVDLVYFPNQLAESFSYALSDVWNARVPVAVPDAGALGERCRAIDGGWLLQEFDDAAAVLALLQGIFAQDFAVTSAQKRRNIIQSVQTAVPSLDNMISELSSFYPNSAAQPAAAPWSPDEVQQVLRQQLDGAQFRHENIRLARDFGQAHASVIALQKDLMTLSEVKAQSDSWARQLEDSVAEFRAQQNKLEADNSALQQSAAALTTQCQMQQQAMDALSHANRTLQESQLQQQAEIEALRTNISAMDEQIALLTPRALRYDHIKSKIPKPLLALWRFARRMLRGRN
jgi:hypothetical protein